MQNLYTTIFATPRCDYLCVVNSTKLVHKNITKVVHMNSSQVVHMNSTKVVHTNSVHGKVVSHSGVATNSTCVSSFSMQSLK